MSSLPATPRPAPRRTGGLLLILAGVVWAATMAHVARRELRPGRASADVQAVVEAAGLKTAWARAKYAVLLGPTQVGQLTSTVTGGQKDEQLAYVVRGTLAQPQPIEVRGFVLAGWDRRVERLVLEASLGPARHRLEGEAVRDGAPAGLFRLVYVPPAGTSERKEWVLPEAPVLAPGPLPLPELDAGPGSLLAGGARSGSLIDPVSGEPRDWSLVPAAPGKLVVAGRERDALRHELQFGPLTATLWTEPTGFPLKLELPAGLTFVLVEDTRR